MTKAVRTALLVWAAISLLIAAFILWIALRQGDAGFANYIQNPPLINVPITLTSVALLWLSVGGLLALLESGRINRSNLLSVGGFFTVCWVYLNLLSERFRYGDYTYYLDAAQKMYAHQPLPGSYFYLPLWATLIQFLAPYGEETFLLALWLLNVFSLLLFYVLLHRTLERYGFAPRLAAIVTTLFMLVNVPILRTLFYVQINLHTLNMVLLSLLLYPRQRFLSAFSLAVAVHLKTAPAVLVLAFLLEMDWRWLGWFIISMLAVAVPTVAINGFSPFLDSLHKMLGLSLSQNTIFHDTSFDSFMRFTGGILHISLTAIRILIYAVKALLAAATGFVLARCIRSAAYTVPRPVERAEAGVRLLNAAPALFILMTLASPIVWEHHGVFVALSFLVLLKRLDRPSDWLLFGFAYLLEFVVPTFDFYPWSYGRLLAPLLVLWLMWKTAAPAAAVLPFDKANRWLEQLAG